MKTIKRRLRSISFVIILISSGLINIEAQIITENWAKLSRYEQENKEVKSSNMNVKTVFIGNSITEMWAGTHPRFFTDNDYIGRGIGGQTTPQFLSRFRQDVINLAPRSVVINGGINDIAENSGIYNPRYTLDCIKSMAELAEYHNIKVILTSILPAANIPWNDNITDVPRKVSELNEMIKEYADEKGFVYVDYYSQMVDSEKAMITEYTSDGVHVTLAGYKVMESIIKEEIDRILSKNE
ncbi:GDSL-type esterase/lipase family protein [Dysgonomonas sp. OttesenSCG-928-M03]|nr:GDSL-type esterase/lipase family protein [Dysgonomonas sp. OttesenSCG-928-M03]